MKYVIDSNVAIKWVKDEPNSDKARRLRDDYRAGIHELLAPDFFIAECGYALFKMEHQKSVVQADQLLAVLLLDCPLLEESIDIVTRASAIVRHIRLSFYDAMFVALAEQKSCQFVTADGGILNGCRKHYPFVVDLATLP